MEKLSIMLKRERKIAGYTQKNLAELLDIPLRTYKAYESLGVNHREPDQAMLLKMAEILDVTVDYLLGRD